MKKILITVMTLLCFMHSSWGFFFNGAYEYTTDRGYTVGKTAATIGEIGDWIQILIPLSALVYSTAIGDWEGNKQLLYAVGASTATTEILKFTIAEERPNAPENSRGRSFPSGHTSFAFSGAGYWQRRYGWYIGAPMYAAASFVGYSRVAVKKHNWLDVGVGAALGIGFNYLFTSRYTGNIRISAEPTDSGAYVGFHTQF